MNKFTAGVFNQIAERYNDYSYLTDIQGILLRKRRRASSNAEYIRILVNNVHYFNQLNEQCYGLTFEMLENTRPDTQGQLERKITDIQSYLRMPDPTGQETLLREVQAKHRTEYDRIEALEFSYCYRKIENDIMLDFLSILVAPANRTLVAPFFNVPPRTAYHEINKYSTLQTNHILKNGSVAKF